jgi:pyrroline-5-carboxylate reductase
MDVRHPDITVKLAGSDGNAFAILGKVRRALIENGVSKEEAAQFMQEAMTGNYDHLLQTCMRWVNCE